VHQDPSYFFGGKTYVLSFDLDFPVFESIPGDDSLGIGSCLAEFHLCNFLERFMEFLFGFA
jgi:hypothetical protein